MMPQPRAAGFWGRALDDSPGGWGRSSHVRFKFQDCSHATRPKPAQLRLGRLQVPFKLPSVRQSPSASGSCGTAARGAYGHWQNRDRKGPGLPGRESVAIMICHGDKATSQHRPACGGCYGSCPWAMPQEQDILGQDYSS